MSKSRTYEYKAPSFEATVDRAEKKGSMFDSIFKDAKLYRSKQGQNLLRILPPGWPNAQHYGLTLFIHRDVGPDNRQYLCLKENAASPHNRCPICEELYKLGSKATQEDRKLYRPQSRMAYYVIDRDNEKDGVQVWVTSGQNDSEIAAQSINRRSKSVIDIVNPDDGYDIEFTRSGTTMTNTRYRGFQVMREPSPLHDNERVQDQWLDVAFDHPLTSLLNFYSSEYLEKVFYGQGKEEQEEERSRGRLRDGDGEEEDERPQPRRTRAVPADDEEETPRSRRRPTVNDDDEPVAGRRRSVSDDDEGKAGADDPPTRRRSSTRSGSSADDDDDTESNTAPSRGRGRGERPPTRDDNDNDERPPARTRHASVADDDDPPPRRRVRSELAEKLDDEIPFEGGSRAAPNGRARDDEDEQPARNRRRPADDDDEETAPAGADEARREKMRARLNRE